MSKKKNKIPKVSGNPQSERQPRAKETPAGWRQPRVRSGQRESLRSWRFSECDISGEWAWTNLYADAGTFSEVMHKLRDFEGLDMSALVRGGSHHVPIDSLSPKAKKRLRQIGKDDVDELMSFRIGGKPRVWCIPSGMVMKILWWDPNHEVVPSTKKRT